MLYLYCIAKPVNVLCIRHEGQELARSLNSRVQKMHHLWPPPHDVGRVYERVIVDQPVGMTVAAVQLVMGKACSVKFGNSSYGQLQ